jgi:hypothetical protein
MQTLEGVQEKVRARCKQAPPLKWRRLSEYSMVSECGEFYVGKAIINSEPNYEVWFKSKTGGSAMHLRMNLPSGEEAKVWASSIANAYRKGELNLKAPPTKEEIQRLRETAGANSVA